MKHLSILVVLSLIVLALAVACTSSDEAEQRLNEGLEAAEAGRLEEAVALFTEAIELEPNDVNLSARAYLNRAAAYGDLGRFGDAVDDAATAIELEPDDVNQLAKAHAVRATATAAMGRGDHGEADFARACELGLIEACDLGP